MDKITELENELLKIKSAQTFGEQVSTIKTLTVSNNEWDVEGRMAQYQSERSYSAAVTYRVYTDKKIRFGEIRAKAQINGEQSPFSNQNYNMTSLTSSVFTGVTNVKEGRDYVEFTITLFAGDQPAPPSFKLKVALKTIDGEYMTARITRGA